MKRIEKRKAILFSAVFTGVGIGIIIHKAVKEKLKKNKDAGGHVPRGLYEAWLKRPLDAIMAAAALTVLSPVMAVLAGCVRIKLGKPVLFKQERTGLNGETFTILKFRTMSDEKDAEGKLLPDEMRLNSFGRKLRSLSLDELPGLYNVINGDLSLVGPRPLPVRYLPYYSEKEMHRHDVRPGITGLAQINGRNYVTWEDKFAMDLEYAENISFFSDLRILLKTVKVVLDRADIETGSSIEHNGHIYRPLDEEREMQ